MTSKEYTSKDYLELIYSDALNFNEFEEDIEEVKREYKIIKQDLERLEKLENDNKELRKAEKSWSDSIPKLIHEKLKLKQALDIIKNKKVDIDMFIDSTSAEDYNKRLEYYTYMNPEVRPLTKEEHELLKEVLGNE